MTPTDSFKEKGPNWSGGPPYLHRHEDNHAAAPDQSGSSISAPFQSSTLTHPPGEDTQQPHTKSTCQSFFSDFFSKWKLRREDLRFRFLIKRFLLAWFFWVFLSVSVWRSKFLPCFASIWSISFFRTFLSFLLLLPSSFLLPAAPAFF